ncbi:DNA-directed RNA polymerase subunit H (RpoH/RPB5) [Croceifilum oryzae]|uniref:DNA-directed RNA polymerase subunit H (RpoH/RPB5) n=1 Tax=Croceifilum oryzae TaxID=1553429 RepID=A0AAJ1TJ00_9BACL|nr:hypothetical protein [Croceifilum oryzae]MDQ0416976.1 DNA-directed RNA polymerase subunit H (RpoH/RPB5) [Croceifilum oryzae]
MMPTIPWSLPNLMLPPCLPDGPNWPWCPQPPSPWPPNSLPDWPPIPMETRDKLLEFLRNELKDRTMPRANSDLELTINMSFTISELLLKVVNSEEGKSILKELDVQLKSITDTNPSLRYAGIIAGVAIGIIIGAVAGAAYEHYHHTHPQ